jgi:hypothetical protein
MFIVERGNQHPSTHPPLHKHVHKYTSSAPKVYVPHHSKDTATDIARTQVNMEFLTCNYLKFQHSKAVAAVLNKQPHTVNKYPNNLTVTINLHRELHTPTQQQRKVHHSKTPKQTPCRRTGEVEQPVELGLCVVCLASQLVRATVECNHAWCCPFICYGTVTDITLFCNTYL